MKNEYLDLVDDNNELTGQTELRSVVHSLGLWHRTVHIYFFRKVNKTIEFLVHLRSKDKDLSPNCWDTRFGGHIKANENLEDAVLNEIREELGFVVNTSDLLEGEWRKRNKYPNCEFSKVYYLEYNKPIESLIFNDGEIQEVNWLSCEEISDQMGKYPMKWSGKKEDFEKVVNFLLKKLEQK